MRHMLNKQQFNYFWCQVDKTVHTKGTIKCVWETCENLPT